MKLASYEDTRNLGRRLRVTEPEQKRVSEPEDLRF